MKRIVIASALLGLLAAAVPAFAHHSFAAEYDGNKPVTITGVLKSVDWRNPHIYYLVDVKDAATGKLETWTLEGYPPNMLVRRADGWTREGSRESWKPGHRDGLARPRRRPCRSFTSVHFCGRIENGVRTRRRQWRSAGQLMEAILS